MTILTEKQLPFKVYRHDRPKIVYGNSVKKGVVGTYEGGTHTIMVNPMSKLEDKEWITEHEISHYQLDDRKDHEWETLSEVADEEMKAELLTYVRLGRLPYRVGGLQNNTIWHSMADNCMQWLESEKMPHKRKLELVLSLVSRINEHYRQYIPQEWLDQYVKFAKEESIKLKDAPVKVISKPSMPVRNKKNSRSRTNPKTSNSMSLVITSRR